MPKLIKLIMKESIQSASDSLQELMKRVKEFDKENEDIKPDDIFVSVKETDPNKYLVYWNSDGGPYTKLSDKMKGDAVWVATIPSDGISESDLIELDLFMTEEEWEKNYEELKDETNLKKESVVLRDAGAKIVDTPEKLSEEDYIRFNDGRSPEDIDYLIQDVTELDEITDEDTESPSIEGLLSLVNESLSNKYGPAWGYLKSKSVSSKKENLSYAIVDIVTPSILKEAHDKKIKDTMVSRTVIMENIKNSNKVNFKINSLAGTTRFSQITNNPVKVFTRWLESEYLFEEMVEDFQKNLEAREKSLKDTTEIFLQQHPDMKVRVNLIKAQYKELKKSDIFEDSEEAIKDLAYGLAAEFPMNISVSSDKENKAEQKFDTIDELVKIVFGKEFVKEDKEPKKSKSLKESYETFKIGEIEGTFNPSSLEVMYSIPSDNVKDKKINLTKVPTTDTPYNTETIIKDYIETNFGLIPQDESTPAAEETPVEVDTEVQTEVEPPNEIEEAELPEEPQEGETPETLEDDVQAETGEASFFKIRQNEPIDIEMIKSKLESESAQKSSYIVVEEKSISTEEMESYLANMSEPQSFLNGVKPVDRKNYAFNVVKLVSNGFPTILIDPVGYDYGRYVGLSE